MTTPRGHRAARAYARLLRLFPPAFRRRFEPDLLDLFRDKHRAASAAGRLALVRFWLRTIADVASSAARERRADRARRAHLSKEPLMQGLLQDVRYALRITARRPAVSIVIVLTLALGIGANTAIFSLVNTVLLGGEPYPDAGRLVMVREQQLQRAPGGRPNRPANFFEWKAGAASFEDVAWSRDSIQNLTGDGEPEMIIGYRFSPNMFGVLGLSPLIGRTFTAEEDRPGAPNVVVLGYPLWQRRYGADRGILGRSIMLDGVSHEVIGVMPPEFTHPRRAELWTPVRVTPELAANRENTVLRIVARLKPGVSMEQAQREMDALYAGMASRYPENAGITPLVEPFASTGDARPLLLVLLAGVGFVLLIACANVANLLLADATARRRELALRSALGASRMRVVRQMLTESVMLALAGGLLGLAVTWWTKDALLTLFPENIANLDLPLIERIDVDAGVFAFALGVSLVTGLVFGMLPAWKMSRAGLQSALKDGDRGGSSSRRTHSALVVAEVSLAIVLLAGALLMVQSFVKMQRQSFGFDPDGVLSARVMLPQYRYPDAAARTAFTRDVLVRMQRIPGVEHAGATNYLPLSGWSASLEFDIEGRPAPEPGNEPNAGFIVASEDFFETMRVGLLAGRAFTAADDTDAPRVIAINETLARRHWPGEDPVGRRVLLEGPNGPVPFEIVGVLGDVRSDGLEQPAIPEMFFPIWQQPSPTLGFVVRAAPGLDPGSLAAQMRAAVWAVDPEQPVTYVLTMAGLAEESLTFRRAGMRLAAAFGVLALVLSAIGIYGVLSYSVSRRAREIGVRMALGATRLNVARGVIREAMTMTAAGCAIGVAAALLLMQLIASLLYETEPANPVTYAAVAGILLAVALVATWVPVRKATAVDPISALRAD